VSRAPSNPATGYRQLPLDLLRKPNIIIVQKGNKLAGTGTDAIPASKIPADVGSRRRHVKPIVVGKLKTIHKPIVSVDAHDHFQVNPRLFKG
jgi:hypothetical protein